MTNSKWRRGFSVLLFVHGGWYWSFVNTRFIQGTLFHQYEEFHHLGFHTLGSFAPTACLVWYSLLFLQDSTVQVFVGIFNRLRSGNEDKDISGEKQRNLQNTAKLIAHFEILKQKNSGPVQFKIIQARVHSPNFKKFRQLPKIAKNG